MSNHTPGRWKVATSGYAEAELDKLRSQQKANANLIAAAPYMLKALEHVAKALDEVRTIDEAIVLTAIRKAKGESCTAR